MHIFKTLNNLNLLQEWKNENFTNKKQNKIYIKRGVNISLFHKNS